ncbi:ABC transporter permease [Dongshaea marina]|uniref:ABC transporter permease n=1 Tax=Dongshaea marina TaxID=2047966 RepID=UPI000D3EDABF|nr:ABC transporter permease subunit [Dongshaea marina]
MRTLYNQPSSRLLPSQWDLFALLLIFSVLIALCWAGSNLAGPFSIGEQIPISLSPWALPQYALETVLRMFIALALSFVFSFIVGVIAAKSERAGKLIIPIIDILQSVPILGYLSILIIFFVSLFPGSLLGPQCAAIFAVFTSQVWNMTLSFYQSLRTVPKELREAAEMYQLSGWQKFWKMEVPFSMPGLLWNAMMSMSGGWFFVVASEAISVGNREVMLPGIGSYIQQAINMSDVPAMGYAIIAMLAVIVLYDQLLFRPLVTWSEKFVVSDLPSEGSSSWFLTLLKRAHWMQAFSGLCARQANALVNLEWLKQKEYRKPEHRMADLEYGSLNKGLWYACLLAMAVVFVYFTWGFIYQGQDIGLSETLHVLLLGLYTAIRVFVLILICSLIWLPVGIWVGLRPRLAQKIQPIAQILAAFPANLFFPLFIILIIHFNLNVEIWCAPLMVLGTQWYILFNVIAGASAIPQELKLAAQNMQVRGLSKWFKYLIPAVFPFYITGAIAAAGGSWNASIVAEVMIWGSHKLVATGLGAYIAENTTAGNLPKIALGVLVMCIWVTAFNRIFWRRLYRYAETRFRY